MIRFEDHDFSHRESWCRREVLRVGGLTSLGLGLSELLAGRKLQANPASSGRPNLGKAKNCIVLFLLGGPPQHSTWDP
ncbi:MAG: DUF1501 domain-containing protein, partial [Gemmataceae bacterium]